MVRHYCSTKRKIAIQLTWVKKTGTSLTIFKLSYFKVHYYFRSINKMMVVTNRLG